MPQDSWYRIENAAASADISIYDEITQFGVTAADFVRELDGLDAQAISLHLNTPGGYVDDGIAIYNALKNHPAKVTAYVEGIAASIGSVIAMAADRVVMAPHTRMMIHEAHSGMGLGDAAAFAKAAERLEAASANIADIYAERAGKDADYWRAQMRSETWYSDREAVASGLADEIGRSNDTRAAAIAAQQIASFDLSRYRDGERIAARLVAELPHGDVLPADPAPVFLPYVGTASYAITNTGNDTTIVISNMHGCMCGGGDDCPLTNTQEPAPEAETNRFAKEREELETALAAVRIGD